MPALIDLRRRIKSVRNTQQITQAMKTVSTAKFKVAQREVFQARPFWHNLPAFAHRATLWEEGDPHPLLQRREERKVLLVVITSDKGLCGAFNANLLARVHALCEEKAKTGDLRLVLIGKKAVTFFQRLPYPVERSYAGQVAKLTREDLEELADFLIQAYTHCRTDGVYVAYNEFKSILSPHVTIIKLLPLEAGGEVVDTRRKAKLGLPPDWEPGARDLLGAILPLYVREQMVHFFSESVAAEHAARMMAMDNATQNAEELIGDLTLVMNKIRQASITKELLEIITAVDALAGK